MLETAVHDTFSHHKPPVGTEQRQWEVLVDQFNEAYHLLEKHALTRSKMYMYCYTVFMPLVISPVGHSHLTPPVLQVINRHTHRTFTAQAGCYRNTAKAVLYAPAPTMGGNMQSLVVEEGPAYLELFV